MAAFRTKKKAEVNAYYIVRMPALKTQERVFADT